MSGGTASAGDQPLLAVRKALYDMKATLRNPMAQYGLVLYATAMTLLLIKHMMADVCPWKMSGTGSKTHTGSCWCSGLDDFCLCSPNVAVDCIMEYYDEMGQSKGLVLVQRRDGRGFAIVGGFCDVGEAVEDAVEREIKEETGGRLLDYRLFGVYSKPSRDRRRHTVSVVYVGRITGKLKAQDDAKDLVIVTPQQIPDLNMAFDHKDILLDYLQGKAVGNENTCHIVPRYGSSDSSGTKSVVGRGGSR